MAGANIEAIRDWSNNFFYTKEEIADFFIKIDSGFKAYKLTIIGDPLHQYTFTESTQTNPQTYTITTDIDGNYTGLFLFHALPVTITCDGTSYVLDSYEKTISLI